MTVTLICGPPCGGKTTLAHRLAQPGDTILDFDVIARQLGSPNRWIHPQYIREQAEEHMRAELRRIVDGDHGGDAIVIRCYPDPRMRAALARAIGADRIIVIAPRMQEVIARARHDKRPRGTESSIRWWYRNYRPDSGDELTRGEGATRE